MLCPSEGVLSQEGSCGLGPQVSCYPVTRGDDVIVLVPKLLPSDHPLAQRPEFAEKDMFICSPLGE